MSTRIHKLEPVWLLAFLCAWPVISAAQVPVDADGQPVGQPATASEELAMRTPAELEELVGPVALYPDDLLAIVLPASTYPLQIVQAARFLDELESDPSLKPDDDWDDSVVALTNYPEVVRMMNKDLDWTWRLGEAVVAQQTDVIEAIEAFRDRAYASGNLKSDDFQTVSEDEGTIQITPVKEDVIYVPYYEPERVVVYQPRPVYYYYPRPYPVYYYPYPLGYNFYDSYFWGVTTAFSIGWLSHDLHVWHYSYYGHPYYGRHYWYNTWWYRRPDIHVYNNYYVRNTNVATYDRYRNGDNWRPQTRRTVRPGDQRITRTRYYPGGTAQNAAATMSSSRRSSPGTSGFRDPATATSRGEEKAIQFRDRQGTATLSRNGAATRLSSATRPTAVRPSTSSRSEDKAIQFRDRPGTATLSRNGAATRLSSATRPSTVKPSAARPSTPDRPTAVKPSTQQRLSFAAPSTRPETVRRPSVSSAPAARQSFARPSVPKQSYPAPSRSRPSITSRPAPSRPAAAKPPSSSRQSVSRPSQSRATASGNSRAARSASSARSSKR